MIIYFLLAHQRRTAHQAQPHISCCWSSELRDEGLSIDQKLSNKRASIDKAVFISYDWLYSAILFCGNLRGGVWYIGTFPMSECWSLNEASWLKMIILMSMDAFAWVNMEEMDITNNNK